MSPKIPSGALLQFGSCINTFPRQWRRDRLKSYFLRYFQYNHLKRQPG